MPWLDLDVFLEACTRPIGRLTRFDDGALGFAYLTDALPHPLSLSLPLREEPFGDAVTRAFFSNLLFENAQRDQILLRYRLDWTDIVGHQSHGACRWRTSCAFSTTPSRRHHGRSQ